MAYVNVAEWKTDQVCEWLKGLENSVLPYVHSFTNHSVNGQQLLNLRPEDLEHLGVLKLGHQEIILEAVEYLRNFHYELDRENLQLLALRLSCQAHSLHNELSKQTDSKPVTTQTLSDVASVMMAVKPLVRWLDRPPFSGQLEYNDKKAELMKLALEMATCAQRDRFAEKPIEEIRTTCGQLAKLADYIIQEIADPMILQPASLDLATLKKKPGDDLGFYILPSFHGAHQIAEIKFGSAAHQCGKMEEGDEIVQVNYQTVVGWERKNLLELFRESPAEILLTLKRRPRHTKVYGQIYIKPYRLPSNKKTSITTRWQHNLPSPRPELLTIPDFTMPLPRHMPKNPSPEPASILDTVNILDTMIIDSSDSDSEAEPPMSIRLYSAKPRNLVQRRATITGASPTTKHGIDIEQFWKELKQEHSTTFQLRDKAASCAHGLDNVPSNLRPQTCLGIEQSKRRKKGDGQTDDKKVQFQEKYSESETAPPESTCNVTHEIKDESKIIQPSEVSANIVDINFSSQVSQTANVTNSNNISDTNVPLDECNNLIRDKSSNNKNILSGKESNVRSIKERGKLDKSYSTPAYDLTDSDDAEDRRQMLLGHSILTLDLPAHNSSSIKNLIKTDIQQVTEDQIKSEDSFEQNDISCLSCNGNVAQKISNIEKHIRQNDNEEQIHRLSQCDSSKNSVQKITDVSYKNNIESNQSNNEYSTSDTSNSDKKITRERLNMELDSSWNAVNNVTQNYPVCSSVSESSKSCIGSVSQNNDSNVNHAVNKSDKTIQNINCKQLEAIKQAEKDFSTLTTKEKVKEHIISYTKPTEHDLKNIQNVPQIQINEKTENYDISSTSVANQAVQACRYVELTKVESAKRSEVKPHLTPPEPPPRKYYSKSATTSSSLESSLKTYDHTENQTVPNVPERPNIRRDLKKSEFLTENHLRSNIDHQEKHDCFDIYSNYTEKPTACIDDTSSAEADRRPSLGTELSIYADSSSKQTREERPTSDKYEPFIEKISCPNQSPIDYYKFDSSSRSVDSPDSMCYSKQPHSIDLNKSKTLEKDKSFEKGVVNKAMMVARSIGLHGSLNKSSSNSPRSSRKRSILFARKRNVSVKDIGAGDLEGWLTYRTRGAGGAWAKAWFVLKCSSLYRFKAQNSVKADCLIALTGFTVSQAAEVKSRKYAFKVYHTGTVFYFAADTEDSLTLWLDAINKATLGADGHSRNSALFSETDESDSEHKSKDKGTPTQECKSTSDKSFGSLKKVVRKDSGCNKDLEIAGASLDRKYLRFLGTKNQNVPVPTAQFRSYRRVLPTSTPAKKQDSTPNSPDLQMTIAGSTFYGLCASQSATDMSTSSQDMGDYRRTTDRCLSSRSRRPDDLQGFITLEEFMLSQQDEERRQVTRHRSVSPRVTPLTSDHVHIQHRNFHDSGTMNEPTRHINEIVSNNDALCPRHRTSDDLTDNNVMYGQSRNMDSLQVPKHPTTDFVSVERSESRTETTRNPSYKKFSDATYIHKRKAQEHFSSPQAKSSDSNHWKNVTNDRKQIAPSNHSKSDAIQSVNRLAGTSEHQLNAYGYAHRIDFPDNHNYKAHDYFSSKHCSNFMEDVKSVPKRLARNDGYSGSSNDLSSHASYETLQRVRKDVSVSRKGSFNLTNRREQAPSDKHWLDSLRRTDKKSTNSDKSRLKNVAQYQPPPIPSSPFEQEGMRAAFEMHLDKNEQVQKANRLKSLFGSKYQQKPCTLDLPKDTQKTLLGSPRLHRAIFREKSSNQPQQRLSSRSSSQSPGDSGISQSLSSFSGNSPSQTLSQSFSSVSSVSDWSPDTPSSCSLSAFKCSTGHPSCQKAFAAGRNSLTPPTLPYIPPPTSPPPDYPGLEYPPVFEPGTYSLSDASLLRNRNKNNQNTTQQ